MRILLADYHALFRSGLSLVLQELEADVCVIEAADFQEAMALASPEVDLALLDLCMPGMEGAKGVSCFRNKAVDMPLVVISASEEVSDIERLLEAGAVGYIPKSSSCQVLLSALRLVLAGGLCPGPGTAAWYVRRWQRQPAQH